MKSYPSIPKMVDQTIPVHMFLKLDGSQIRAEWNDKRKFYKFATRSQLIDNKSDPWGIAINLIQEKYSDSLSKIFSEQDWKETVCYFELWGANSFAGTHDFKEPLTTTLFDLSVYKKGILPPDQFVKLFSHLDIPPVLGYHHIDANIFDKIKKASLPGLSEKSEGVVCKGIDDDKLVFFKIKTNNWLNRLKEKCQNDLELFNKLA